MKKLALASVILIFGGFGFSKSISKEAYKIVNKIHLDGDQKWDYLFSDDSSGRLYVSHGNMVQVVDETSGKEVGKITNLDGVHGIAIAPSLNKGFISTKNDNSVTIFNTKTFEVIKKIKVTGKSPDAILFDSFSQKVFVFNGHSNNATVLNAETNEVVATIAFKGNPEASVTDEKGKIYVNLEDAGKIAVINASTYKVENVWPIAPGKGPTGLALDNETHRLFSACANKMMVITDAETGKVITTLPIGEDPDGAAFDPETKCAFSSNKVGTLTIVKEVNKDSFSVLDNLPTQLGAKTITLNKLSHHIYLSAADFDLQSSAKHPNLVSGSFVVLDILPQ